MCFLVCRKNLSSLFKVTAIFTFNMKDTMLFSIERSHKIRKNLRVCTGFKPLGVNVNFRQLLSGV